MYIDANFFMYFLLLIFNHSTLPTFEFRYLQISTAIFMPQLNKILVTSNRFSSPR